MGNSTESPEPLIIQIEVTTRCNLTCRLCPHSELAETQDMAFETFRYIVDQIQTPPSPLYLCGLGEPLMHPDLERMIIYCSSRGIHETLIHTNGLLLTSNRATSLAQTGLHEIRLSIDGGDEETLKQVRPGVTLDQLIRNAQYVTRHTSLALSLYFTLNEGNIHSLPSLVDVALEMGVRQIFLADTVPFFDAGSSKAIWATRSRKTAEIACKNKDLFLDQFWQRCRAEGIEASGALESFRSQCSEPFHKLYITVSGDATPCCRIHQVRLGNILETGLDKVWHGKALETWRNMLVSGQPAQLCRQLCNLPTMSEPRNEEVYA